MTSAFSLRRSTVARRTVQTLIGSYVALRTSTRPPDQRPVPSAFDPCRWWSESGTDPTGPGGTAVAIAGRSVENRAVASGGGRERAEHPYGLATARQSGDRVRHAGLDHGALEIAEEHVVTQPDPARARLDPREVDAARGELAQAVDEPARRQVAGAPEDQDRLARSAAGGGASGVRRALDPGEPGRVVGVVLDVLGEHRRAVQPGRVACPDRGVRLRAGERPALGDRADGVGGRALGDDRRTRQLRAQEAGALAERLRMRVDRAHLVGRYPLGRGEAVRDRVDHLADDPHVGRVEHERVERRSDRALAGVLERYETAVDLAVLHGADHRGHGRQRDLLDVEPGPDQRVVGVRPRRPEVAGPHQSSSTAVVFSPASARRIASSSSGESRYSPRPSTTCLQYSRAVSRWAIEERTTPLRTASSSASEAD